jgi:hypothetical protein
MPVADATGGAQACCTGAPDRAPLGSECIRNLEAQPRRRDQRYEDCIWNVFDVATRIMSRYIDLPRSARNSLVVASWSERACARLLQARAAGATFR